MGEGLAGYWNADNGSLENLAEGGTITTEISGNSSNVTVPDGLNFQNEFTITMWFKDSQELKESTSNTVIIQQSTSTGRSLLFRTSESQYGTFLIPKQ